MSFSQSIYFSIVFAALNCLQTQRQHGQVEGFCYAKSKQAWTGGGRGEL